MQSDVLRKFCFSIGLILIYFQLLAKQIDVFPNRDLTIQKAFNQAKPGDSIILHPGDYYEVLNLVEKSDLTVTASGKGLVRIYGVMPEFTEHSNDSWKFVAKQKNAHFDNTQWIYEADIPKRVRIMSSKLPDYWHYRNNFYLSEEEMLWSYADESGFADRKITGTDGEGVLFSREKIKIAINVPIASFRSRQFVTYSGQVLKIGNLARVIFDGGPNKLIEFRFAGRYCIAGGGRFENVTFRNLRFTNPNNAFYFNQSSGSNLLIENCYMKKNIPFDCLWSEIKASTTMEGTAIAYAGAPINPFIVRNSVIRGFFNGIVALPGHAIIESNTLQNIGDDAIELDGPAIETIVRNNRIIDCFVSLSLVPVEIGPVHIYNNLISNSRSSYPYLRRSDGKIRMVPPRPIKFWNLPNGKKMKDGHSMKVSGNVHIYYNTIVSPKDPLTVGNYAKKEYSPVNSTIYNNVFMSKSGLTHSTGFAQDGIDIDNNVFWSTREEVTDDRLFIGWNGANHGRSMKRSKEWTGNRLVKLDFKKNKVEWKNRTKRALKKFELKILPDTFPDAEELNARTKPGAEINSN